MKILKIAILNDYPFDVGISNYVYGIYLNLKKHNIHVEFYQFALDHDRNNKYFQEVNIVKGINFRINKSLQLNQILGINYRAFKKLNSMYDIIIISNPTLNKVSRYFDNVIAVGLDLYYLFGKSNSILYSKYIRNQYKLFKKFKLIICDSNFTKKEFIKYLGIEDRRIHAVYPAINTEIFHPGDRSFRRSLDINDEDILLLNVAYDGPNKNIKSVLELLYKLPENFKLIRIGRNFSSLKTIKDLKLENRVYLFENLDSNKLGDIYRSSDFFVFPSLFEGFGIPVAEAMAVGLPVIVSNRTALPEVVGDAGLIFDPYDIEGMKNAILELSKNEEKYNFMKEKSIERAKIFSYENQFKSLNEVFYKFMNTF
ncbi:MAG: glycosyltransferase family 1 protein [Candidatus Micrarchaeaceae archaeon]